MPEEKVRAFLAYLLSRAREPYVRRLTGALFILQGFVVGGFLMFEHTYFSGIDNKTLISHEWYGLFYLMLNLGLWYLVAPKNKPK